MHKIIVDGEIDLASEKSTVGVQLYGLLMNMPSNDAKVAVRQYELAKDLKKINEAEESEFCFEEADLSALEAVVDAGAKNFASRLIAPIKIALNEKTTFKVTKEPKVDPKPGKSVE